MVASLYQCDDCRFYFGEHETAVTYDGKTLTFSCQEQCAKGYDPRVGDCADDDFEPEEHYIPPAHGKYGWTDEEAAEYGDMMGHMDRDEGRYREDR